MKIEFWPDPQSGEPHIFRHAVSEEEVEQVLDGPNQLRPGHEGAIVALGPTLNGRFLKVVFRKRDDGTSFVITAFDAPKASVKLYKRKQKKKK